MQKIFVRTHGKNVSEEFKPDVPKYAAPVILREYTFRKTRYYKTEGGATYDADTYDAIFKTNKGRILPKNTKGKIGISGR
jgi:hypothetical protein